MNKMISRTTFQAIVIGDYDEKEVTRIANHIRFKQKIYMVDGTWNRIEVRKLASNMSVFTVINEYVVGRLGFKQYIQHLLCKLRAAAFHYMGCRTRVPVITDDTRFPVVYWTF